MDKTYESRLALRKKLLDDHHDVVIGVYSDKDTRVREAVRELYAFVLGWYLPRRYPGMFRVVACSGGKGNGNDKTEGGEGEGREMLENLVTGDVWPTELDGREPVERGLEMLCRVVDEDFLILLPDLSSSSSNHNTNQEPKYILTAYTTCFPSGFNPRHKLGLRLADIHAPVPGYRTKLEKSMDRFFAKLEVGKVVGRVNWSVTAGTGLFAAFGGTHARQGEEEEGEAEEMREMGVEEVDDSVSFLFAFYRLAFPLVLVLIII